MAGVSPEDMLRAPRRFRPAIHQRGFEGIRKTRQRDRAKAALLRRVIADKLVTGDVLTRLQDLADRLATEEALVPKSPPMTMASSRWMRRVRNRVVAYLWKFLGESPGPQAFVTLIPPDSDIPEDALMGFDPAQFLERLRGSLNRAGAGSASGSMWCVLEAEYQMDSCAFRFHFHAIVTGDMVQVVRRLRKQRAYRSNASLPSGRAPSPKRRLQVKSPLYDLPRPLSYTLKDGWNGRWVDPEGKRGPRRELRGKAAALALLWLDQHQLSDLTLMMGMRANQRGFTALKRTRVKGGGGM